MPSSSTEVWEVVRGLRQRKSVGYDNISIQLVKYCSFTLSVILSSLFNDCIESGYYPDEFKIARAIPIHKSGARDQTLVQSHSFLSLIRYLRDCFTID